MKTKTSMKICNGFSKVWRCGYCDLQNILPKDDARYYNCGVYGWNCDLYVDFKHDSIITTGYRNMRGKRIPSELIEKYSKKAEAIRQNFDWNHYEERGKALEANKEAFLEELSTL